MNSFFKFFILLCSFVLYWLLLFSIGERERVMLPPGLSEDHPNSIIHQNYTDIRVKDYGNFGIVYKANVRSSGERIAIKKISIDERKENRELWIMKMFDHPNVVKLLDSFTERVSPDVVYLYFVMEYVPHNLSQYTRRALPMLLVKTYMYQLFRALSYIHSLSIIHRDIKPQNLLIDTFHCTLKLCDFGSAKRAVRGQSNLSYICSRYYRAPELIFESKHYNTAIDVWSAGCVMAELLIGTPLFLGENQTSQLIKIVSVLGTPSIEDIKAMNPSLTITTDMSKIEPTPWENIFPSDTPSSAMDLLTQILVYNPSKRIHPLQACSHPFFDELRIQGTLLPSGKPLPPLFNFSPSETALAKSKNILDRLLPPYCNNSPPSWLENGCAPDKQFGKN